jgi:hypothetical protein
MKILLTDLEETEARNDCASEDQQQFNRPTEMGCPGIENIPFYGIQQSKRLPHPHLKTETYSFRTPCSLVFWIQDDGRSAETQ